MSEQYHSTIGFVYLRYLLLKESVVCFYDSIFRFLRLLKAASSNLLINESIKRTLIGNYFE